MKNDVYLYGIPEDGLKENLETWLENPYWREYYETAPSDLCRTVISLEFWESEHETGAADYVIRDLESSLSAEDWRHLGRYCGNNPRKQYIHDRILDLELKDQFEILTDIRLHPENYFPLVDHAEWHHESRTKAGDVNIGWNIGLLEGNRPWFGECWSTEGITMLTYFISTRDMEDRTPEQLRLLLEEAGIVKFIDTDHDNTPAVMKFTDGKGNEFYSVNITVGVEDEIYTTRDSGIVYSFRELNRFNETVFEKMKEERRVRELTADPHYPCHLYGIPDAEEAFRADESEKIRDYGECVTLEDDSVLHMNYPALLDEGGRYLLRCKVCGGLMLVQHAMDECPYQDDPDLYYSDRIPVASVEEADLLNILWDEEELKQYPFRCLRRDDMQKSWKEGKEPVPYAPEELKEKIREKYSGLSKKHRAMLEKLIAEAGKETEKTKVLTAGEKTAQGNEYNNRGWELQNSNHPDLKKAASWYEKAAGLGNTAAMVNRGNIYEEQGKPRKAYEWYMRAAHAGNNKGWFNMARMFFHGEGVKQDYQAAYQYFMDLYEKDYTAVCLYLGLYAEYGFLEEPDYEAALKYYEQGIEAGDEYCPVNLGRMYSLGIGVPVDLKKGLELYRLGWERGDAMAATNIAYCYEVGQGIRKNRKKAIEYYIYAAELGEEHAIEALERLGKEET